MIFKLIFSVLLSYILYKVFFVKRKVLYSFNPTRLKKQSRETEPKTFVNSGHDDSEFENFIKDCKSLYEAFQRGLKRSPNAPCMGYKGPFTPYKVHLLHLTTYMLY